MSLKQFLYLVLVIVSGISCSQRNPVFITENNSSVHLMVIFEPIDLHPLTLQKPSVIKKVVVTVTGPGMSAVTNQLTMSGKTASGSIEVPKGNNRSFEVNGIDANDIVQFSGSTTQNITSNIENVSVTVSWIAPSPVTFTVSNITSTTIDISWSICSAQDFAFYRLLLSTTTPLDPTTDKLEDIFDRNKTSGTISGLIPATQYYISILVVDTESLYNTNAPVKSFSTATQTQRIELKYDDGVPTDGYCWKNNGQGSANLLTAPGRAKLITARYYFTTLEGGNFRSKILSTTSALGSKNVVATNTGWFDVDFSGDNIWVNDNFYIMIEYDGVSRPYFGYDPIDNGRAWDYDGTSWTQFNATYFIRAIVEIGGHLIVLKPNQSVFFTAEDNESFTLKPCNMPVSISTPDKKLSNNLKQDN